ncbi:MAG TPA: methyltransferase domain-containing protein [Solirubrobacteraceae bacterium]|nr:methyltransferase domain-containing protein [Solirubrobacteraceae bacterium]
MTAAPDMIEEVVLVGGREIVLERPRDSETLLDADAFGADERLPYWADLWPSGVALAAAVVGRSLRGRRVLELGCGLGLAAICAALAHGKVTASDWFAPATEIAGANARRNGVEVDTVVCSWQQPEVLLAAAPWDLVLAADVLYERRNVPLLLDLLPRLVGERGEIWLADPGRAFADEFFAQACARGWRTAAISRSASPRATVHLLRPGAAAVPASRQGI